MWYFAYGSNLHQPDLDAWCGEKGLPCLDLRAKTWKRATLHDFALVFDCYSKRRGCFAANIRPVDGGYVKGVVFELTDVELKIIARKEGAPRTYVQRHVEVALEDGTAVSAKTFSCLPGTEQDRQKPSEDYLDLIIHGATAYGIDHIWLEKLRQVPTT